MIHGRTGHSGGHLLPCRLGVGSASETQERDRARFVIHPQGVTSVVPDITSEAPRNEAPTASHAANVPQPNRKSGFVPRPRLLGLTSDIVLEVRLLEAAGLQGEVPAAKRNTPDTLVWTLADVVPDPKDSHRGQHAART